jgi:hypothetical protein
LRLQKISLSQPQYDISNVKIIRLTKSQIEKQVYLYVSLYNVYIDIKSFDYLQPFFLRQR